MPNADDFWNDLYANLVDSHNLKFQHDISMEKKKESCKKILYGDVQRFAKENMYLDMKMLKDIGIEIEFTFLLRYGLLSLKKDIKKIIIRVNDELDKEKFEDVLYHELGHYFLIDKKIYDFYANRNTCKGLTLRLIYEPDEYDINHENLATEIGNYLKKILPLSDDSYYHRKDKLDVTV